MPARPEPRIPIDTPPVQNLPHEPLAVFALRLTAFALWALTAAAIWSWAGGRDQTPVTLVAEAIEALRDQLGLAAVAYIAAYALRPFFFFSAAVLTLAGGFLFGPVNGFLLTIVAANLSAGVAYAIGRAFGRGVLADERAQGLVARWARRMRERAFETVLIMRFLLVPYDAVSYLAGFLRMRFGAFIGATALGSLTGTAQFVLLGASLERFTLARPTVDLTTLLASFVFFALGLGLSRIMRRREREREAAIGTGLDADA